MLAIQDLIRKLRRHCPLVLALGSVLFVVFGVWASAWTQESEVFPPSWMQSPLRTDSEIIHVRLSGQDYYIPANYFDSPVDPGLDQRNILLVALLPDLEGRTKENWDEFMKVPGWGSRVRMLITGTKDPEHFLRSVRRNVEKLYGPYVPSSTFNGLIRLTSTKPPGAKLLAREVYFSDMHSTPREFITCAGDNEFPTPGCSHYFIAGSVIVEASYHKKYLQNWQNIHMSIGTWLNSHKTASTELQ